MEASTGREWAGVTIAYQIIAAAAAARYLDIVSNTGDICPRAHLHFTAPDQSRLAPRPARRRPPRALLAPDETCPSDPSATAFQA